MGFIVAIILSALFVAPAAAIDADIIKSTAGFYFLAESTTGKGCNLELLTDESIGGQAVNAPVKCMVGKQRVDEISAWNLDGEGGIIFLNPVRRVVFRLTGQEDGSWTAATDDGDLALVPSYKGVTAIPTAAGTSGTWQLARPGGKSLCTVALANQPQASGEGSLALTVAEGCDKAIAALKLDGWMIEGVTLALRGPKDYSFAFIADGKGGFVKAPREKGKALVMTPAK